MQPVGSFSKDGGEVLTSQERQDVYAILNPLGFEFDFSDRELNIQQRVRRTCSILAAGDRAQRHYWADVVRSD